MSKREHRFRLKIGNNFHAVTPLFGNSLEKEVAKENNTVFGRDSMSETLVFQRLDYDLIFSEPVTREFEIYIDLRVNNGAWQQNWFVGKFTRSDCKIFEDEQTIEVQCDPVDRYQKTFENIDKEFNLIELAPEVTELTFVQQPLLQVYLLGSNVLMNFLSGTYWETPIDPVFTSIQTDDYFFGSFFEIVYIPGESGALLDPDVSGLYDYGGGAPYDRQDGHYRIEFTGSGPSTQWRIVDLFDSNNVVYTAPIGEAPTNPNPFTPGALFTSTSSASTCRVFAPSFTARILTNAETIGGTPTDDIADPDITNSGNYTKVLPIDNLDTFILFDGNSADPDQYGKFADTAANFADLYFTRTLGPSDENTFPVNRFEWTEFSIWFYYDAAMKLLQEQGANIITYQHTYKFADIISAFLGVIDADLTHEETLDYSQFLYGTGNTIRGSRKYPIFAPKSNIIEGEYDQPAQTALCRFSDFLNFAEFFWQVYWFIDDDNKFIFEHIEYFNKGKSYTSSIVATDLRNLIEPTTELSWEYDQKKWEYDKEEMPEQIRHTWMDKSSLPFKGYPIEHLDDQVQKGSFDDKNMSLFTSDIDFMLGNTEEIGGDGFFFCEAIPKGGGGFQIPFVEFLGYNMQNGYASIIYAHAQYWKYNLHCENVRINNEDTTAESIKRTRVQEVEYTDSDEPDVMQLVWTSVGIGLPSKKRVNLLTGTIQLTIRHDSES